jgi:hypothetical protein
MNQPSPEEREQAREEIRTAIAILTAQYQVLNGQMSGTQFGACVTALVGEQWSDDPWEAVHAMAYTGLRLASLLSWSTGSTVAEILQNLGAEAATRPGR